MIVALTQAAVYGKCVVADYNSVHKDKCAAEFMKLKDCYLVWDHGPTIQVWVASTY